MTARSRRWWEITSWAVWSLPSNLLTSVLVIESLTLIIVVFDFFATPFGAWPATAIAAGSLIIGGIVHGEASARVERVRRRIGLENVQLELTSVWTFAGALLLTPLAATAVVILLRAYLYVRVWRPAKSSAYRHVFTTATLVLAVHAAAAVNSHLGGGVPGLTGGTTGLLPVIAAGLAFLAVNMCLVLGVVAVSSNRSIRELLGHGDDVVLEISTLCLGALVALAMTAAGPWLVVMVLPPMLVLHRAVLVRKLQEAVNTDSKTGLLTAAAWQKRAMDFVGKATAAARSAAVLILDLDHFKRVNDTYGHLAGDAVLRAVARELRSEVREQDQVGRFGGEEFLILLPGAVGSYDRRELYKVAERIRSSVAALVVEIPTADGPLTIDGLSVSIGGARFPEDGPEVPQLVSIADAALYDAKHSGRNAIRIGSPKRRIDPAPEPVERDVGTQPPAPGGDGR